MTTFDLSQLDSAWGEQVFTRDLPGNAINSAHAMHVHPAWAMDKTFTAPIAGWYHLRADHVKPFTGVCGGDQTGDGALLEAYHVSSAGFTWSTERLWATLVTGRNCEEAVVSINEYLEATDRLIIRGATHSPNNANDGIEVDPYVVYLGNESEFVSHCVVALSPTGDEQDRTGEINSAIVSAGNLTPACPRAEVRLAPGDYYLQGSIGFGGNLSHVTLRGDATGTRAQLKLMNRSARGLSMDGVANEVRGVDFDYGMSGGVLQVPFTQGTIQQLDTAPDQARIVIDTGFDSTFTDPSWANAGVGVTEGLIVGAQGAIRSYVQFPNVSSGLPQRDANGWVVMPYVTLAGPYSPPAVGDKLVITARRYDGAYVFSGQDNRLTDVDIHAAPGLAVVGLGANGLHLRRFRVVPGPAVNGVNRAISTNADAVHLKNLRRGATIDDCEFSGLPEDAINNHADSFFLDQPTPGIAGDYWIVYQSDSLSIGNGGQRVQGNLSSYGNRGFDISASGEGMIVRGSSFLDSRGNGIVVRGGKALVTGNTFSNLTGRSVLLETLMTAQPESASAGNDEGPYPYYSYVRHNMLLSGSWGYGVPPIDDQDNNGCSPWLNRAAVCYPEDFGPSSVPNPAANVITPNP